MNINYFINEKGRVNSMKLREKWISNHLPEFYKEVNNYINTNNIIANRFVEKLWYYFNNITETKICKNINCKDTPTFIGLNIGYLKYCSSSCSNSSSFVKLKKIQKNISKFGVANPYQSKEIIEKIKKTNLKKYGVTNPMQSDSIKNNMICKSIKKTGKPWALSIGGTANITKRNNNKISFEKKYLDLKIVEYSEEKFGICTFYKELCNHTFTINKWQAHLRKLRNVELCTICNPIGSFNSTKWQNEVSIFLKENNIEFIEQDRSIIAPFELDFLIPNNSLAIELNGLYWHSINFKEQNYHLNKTNKCEEMGIQLIHIFEDEWINHKEIVKSRLLNIFKKNTIKIFARKCKIKEISGMESRMFLNENHIQGYLPSTYKYGLYYNNELVSIMTFGQLRKILGSNLINDTYEMYRFCNKLNTTIIGGASKLLKFFINEISPKSIISYADRRWSVGSLYESLGFTKIFNTKPNFWYVNGEAREHRFNYTRNKLTNKFNMDPTKSTDDLILELGLTKIYDSGNIKFELCLDK